MNDTEYALIKRLDGPAVARQVQADWQAFLDEWAGLAETCSRTALWTAFSYAHQAGRQMKETALEEAP